MDDEGQSGLDSPTLQSNPGTPLPAHQVSNPGTPRSEDLICPPNAMAGALPTSATSLISVATHLSSMAGGSNSNSSNSNNNNSGGPLLLQVAAAGAGHSVGPGCVPQGSSITQSMTTCVNRQPPQSKYAQLLAVIEDLGKDIRPTYAGSKSSAERLKRGIVHARILVRECLMETERSART